MSIGGWIAIGFICLGILVFFVYANWHFYSIAKHQESCENREEERK